MTLFNLVAGLEGGLFQRVLDRFFDGNPDEATLTLLSDGDM